MSGVGNPPRVDLSIHTLIEHLIPSDSRVEIDAKIAAGYFTSGKPVTEQDLVKTVSRAWEETLEHILQFLPMPITLY